MSTPTRYGASREQIDRLLDDWGEPRYRGAQLWDALYTQQRGLDDITTLPRALRARLADALPLVLDEQIAQTALDEMTSKWLWACGRRRAGRDGAHAVPHPRDGVRVVASGLRDGVHVLRDRAGRVRTAPHRERDRRAGDARGVDVTATGQQRRLHGDGRAARELRRGVGVDRAPARRRRHLGAPDHRQHRRRRPEHPPARGRTTPRDARGVAARGHRHPAQRARAPQPALPDHPGARRGRRVRRRPRAGG